MLLTCPRVQIEEFYFIEVLFTLEDYANLMERILTWKYNTN